MIKSACKVDSEGRKRWYLDGQLHNEDGPAFDSNKGKAWFVNGKLHRIGGPAIELSNGDKEWWLNGKPHRTDGPAVEWSNDTKEWWLNGVEYSIEDYLTKLKRTWLRRSGNQSSVSFGCRLKRLIRQNLRYKILYCCPLTCGSP